MNAHLEDVAEPVRHKKTTSNIVDFTTLSIPWYFRDANILFRRLGRES